MNIDCQQFAPLLPLLIIGSAIIILILFIICHRNHFIVAVITAVSLQLSLYSLYFSWNHKIQNFIEFILIDRFSIFYVFLILLSSLITVFLSYSWLSRYSGNKEEFYLLILIASMGSIVLVCTSHCIVLVIGMELLSIPLFGMIGYKYHNRYAIEASIKYTLLSSISISFLLLGIAMIYLCIGKLSLLNLDVNIGYNHLSQLWFMFGLIMMITGFGCKLSLVPFHSWTPDVYQGSSIPVIVFLTIVSKIAIFVAMIRIFYSLSLIYGNQLNVILSCITSGSMLFGNLIAIQQNNIKRILGYSSIANLGYVLVGLLVHKNYDFSLETIGMFLFSYTISTIGVFSVMNILSDHCAINNNDIAYRGLFWKNPLLTILFTIIILSLAGIPITLGFISKLYLIILSISNESWFIVIVMLLSSLIGIFVYIRIIVDLYLFTPLRGYSNVTLGNSWILTCPGFVVLIVSFLILLFGIYPQPLITIINYIHPVFICNI